VDLSKQVSIQSTMNFTTAIEVSIAMPVSWLPLIGDYAKDGESRNGVFLSSFLGYAIASVFMYALGLAITVYTGKDVVKFIAGSSAGIVVCLVVLLSTVTTTFLDIFSAVESSKQIINIKSDNFFISLYCIIAGVLAYVFPMESYQNFLLMIGSIFVPVYTVVFAAYFLKERNENVMINVPGIMIAALGTILYNYLTKAEIGIPTVLTFAAVFISYISVKKILVLGGVRNA
jgi:putative hydroxymethylpyrimidine transporter CytX